MLDNSVQGQVSLPLCHCQSVIITEESWYVLKLNCKQFLINLVTLDVQHLLSGMCHFLLQDCTVYCSYQYTGFICTVHNKLF